MANYATLKSAIQSAIKANGNNEITGNLLQQILVSMANSLGAQFQFGGIATVETNPGTPDYNVAYLVAAGTYPNFGGLTIPSGYIGVLKYNGQWTVETLAVGGGGGGGATTLGGLEDVDLTTPPTNGQTLVFDANIGKWKAETSTSSRNVFFGTCPSSEGLILKDVTVSGFTDANLVEGTILFVLFEHTNTSTTATISINGGLAKGISHGQSVMYMWGNNSIVTFVYNNGNWRLEGNLAYTNRYGGVMLVNTISSLVSFKNTQNRYSITPRLAYNLYLKTLSAPRIQVRRGYDSRQNPREYLVCSHPMNNTDSQLTGCYVLMMYSKRRRRRVTAKGLSPLKAKIKEGWGEARGALATNTPLTWTADLKDLDNIRSFSVIRYVNTVNGGSVSSLAAFKTANYPIFGARTAPQSTRAGHKNNRLFGVAWRINNPEYVAPAIETETTRVDVNGHPRYIYSEVAPLRVWINTGTDDFNTMGFQVAPYKDGGK